MTDETKTCVWQRDADDDTYQACGNNSFFFVDGTLESQDGFKWCPYCGSQIEAIEPRECTSCFSEFTPDSDEMFCSKCDESTEGTNNGR